uniref:Family with sequence similarity 237 member B n=1 Tax=Oncorhynchus kisutch TaxID=8019 RepID=A0A8C7FP35_ONCKI
MLLTLSTASSNTMPNFLFGTDGAGGVGLGVGLGGFMAPGNLDEIDSGCWDLSSLMVIQTRRLRLADSRGALWDFMTYLLTSQKHYELFLELTQHFWAMYVDCMLSRAHGLGERRRELENAHLDSHRTPNRTGEVLQI